MEPTGRPVSGLGSGADPETAPQSCCFSHNCSHVERAFKRLKMSPSDKRGARLKRLQAPNRRDQVHHQADGDLDPVPGSAPGPSFSHSSSSSTSLRLCKRLSRVSLESNFFGRRSVRSRAISCPDEETRADQTMRSKSCSSASRSKAASRAWETMSSEGLETRDGSHEKRSWKDRDDKTLTGTRSGGPLQSHHQRRCSHEAQLEGNGGDTSVDELAGYFDLQVHIPRKMSFMAELMYT